MLAGIAACRRCARSTGIQVSSSPHTIDGTPDWNRRVSFGSRYDPFIKCDSNLKHYRQLHIHGANVSSLDHNKRALQYMYPAG